MLVQLLNLKDQWLKRNIWEKLSNPFKKQEYSVNGLLLNTATSVAHKKVI